MRLLHLPDSKSVSLKEDPLVLKYMARRVLLFREVIDSVQIN